MRQDLADFVGVMRTRFPRARVVVLGESMGGAVAMTAFASSMPPAADGLVLVAPAVWGNSALPFTYRFTAWTMAHTLRWWTVTSKGLNIRATDNDDILREMGRDPFVIKSTRADAVYGLVRLMGEARDAAPRVRGPTLLIYGGHDQIVPRKATEEAIEKLPPGASVKFYPNGYHMLLRDRAARPRWDDVADWVLPAVTATR
jgi:alpha-beta hydrolase superfamily lysophospholipase